MEIIQGVFYILCMHMYFILTRTVEMLHKTYSTYFILLLDMYILNSFWIIRERKRKQGLSCLFLTALQISFFSNKLVVIQYSNMNKKGYIRLSGHACCFRKSALLCELKTISNRKHGQLRLLGPAYSIIDTTQLSFTHFESHWNSIDHQNCVAYHIWQILCVSEPASNGGNA